MYYGIMLQGKFFLMCMTLLVLLGSTSLSKNSHNFTLKREWLRMFCRHTWWKRQNFTWCREVSTNGKHAEENWIYCNRWSGRIMVDIVFMIRMKKKYTQEILSNRKKFYGKLKTCTSNPYLLKAHEKTMFILWCLTKWHTVTLLTWRSVPWIWFCRKHWSVQLGSLANRARTVSGISSIITNGTKARAAISRER